MADQTQADMNVGGTQPEPMPSSNQQTSSEPVAQQAAPQEVSEGAQAEPTLSDGASERTRQNFEKLKDDLRREREKNAFYEQTHSSKPPQPVEAPLYDPQTGYVDVQQLERMRTTASTAEKKALEASQKFERYIQQQQEQEAYTAHPELNPDAHDHDSELFKLTRAIITDSMMNPHEYGGKELSAKQAADMAKKQRNKIVEQAKQVAATEAIEQLTPKEQASLEATGRSDRRVDVRSYEELSDRTRRGDTDAIMERFRNIG